ncbi:alpha/beta hydrolase [uncultured Limosilactobacillus sp.]|uniref:alpha/beta hydrolase n=1 Tax=uncultured Limosilactobacillus sp. TaxID=2837629 RepID=UPI0025E4AFF0|nr:alpha/beta hydrolase [uncultured Limosilactobacillus sp.]
MKKFRIVGSFLLGIAVVGLIYQQGIIHSSSNNFIQSTTPTLFFHGWGSSAHAEQHMVNAAKKAGVTKTIVQANVNKNGHVTLTGKIPRHAINPIIMVNYVDNKNSNYHQDGKYALNVIEKLQNTYHFKQINLVGHSMGNMSISFYLLDNAQDQELPQLNKQVAIAGHFDGIKGRDLPDNLDVNSQTGQPNKMTPAYRQLLGLRNTYPQSARVLNMYGDIGNGSDGAVTNDSSRTMRYLVADRAASYQEKKLTGKQAQHSKLHSDRAVDRALINFLWAK